MTPTERALLARLRREHTKVRANRIPLREAPTLHALAMAARASRGRVVKFAGLRFPCKFGLWRYVLCPQTGEALFAVAGAGGWL